MQRWTQMSKSQGPVEKQFEEPHKRGESCLGENLVMPFCLSSAMDRMILHVRQEKPLVSKIMSDLSDTLAIV